MYILKLTFWILLYILHLSSAYVINGNISDILSIARVAIDPSNFGKANYPVAVDVTSDDIMWVEEKSYANFADNLEPDFRLKSNSLLGSNLGNLKNWEKRESKPGGRFKDSPKWTTENSIKSSKRREPLWEEWTPWSSCSVTCGKGRHIRWRHCREDCDEAEIEMMEKACQMPACPQKLFGLIKL